MNVDPKSDVPLPFDVDVASLLRGVWQASEAILEVYDQPSSQWQVAEKPDDSPVTLADKRSDGILREAWERASAWPREAIVSEEAPESCQAGLARLRRGEHCVLIDPLDGTKEFIRRSGQFVISVGAVLERQPVFGLIHAPVTGETVLAWKSPDRKQGVAFAWEPGKKSFVDRFRSKLKTPDEWLAAADKSSPGSRVKILLSGTAPAEGLRSRLDESLSMAGVKARYVPMGSALKFLRTADGVGDVYLRRAPTAIWDTAAGQAILECSGGLMVALSAETYGAFRYEGEGVLNPSFACFRPGFSSSMAKQVLVNLARMRREG